MSTALVTRADARLPTLWTPDMGPVSTVFAHHSVTSAAQAAVAAMRDLEAHARALGHRAIDYSWEATQRGERVEGRGWNRTGGHTLNNNGSSYGICAIGDYRYDDITEGLLNAFADIIREGINRGSIRTPYRLLPHYSVFPTACPARLAERLPEIERRVRQGSTTPSKPRPPALEVPVASASRVYKNVPHHISVDGDGNVWDTYVSHVGFGASDTQAVRTLIARGAVPNTEDITIETNEVYGTIFVWFAAPGDREGFAWWIDKRAKWASKVPVAA